MDTTETTTNGLLRVLSESLATRRVFSSGVAGLAIAAGFVGLDKLLSRSPSAQH